MHSDTLTIIQTAMPKARLRNQRRIATQKLAELRERLSTAKLSQRQKDALQRSIKNQKAYVTSLQDMNYEALMPASWKFRIKKGKEIHPYFGAR